MAANPFSKLGRKLAFKQQNRNFLLFCLGALFFFAGAGLLPLYHQTAGLEEAVADARQRLRDRERLLRISAELSRKLAFYNEYSLPAASAPVPADNDPVTTIHALAARHQTTIREITTNLPSDAQSAAAIHFNLLLSGGLPALQATAGELATMPGLISIEQAAVRRESTGFLLTISLTLASGDQPARGGP